MRKLIVSSILVFITLSAQAAASQVTSDEIKTGEQLTASHVFSGFGYKGDNIPPLLTWSGALEGTKSFTVTAYDLDTSTGSGWRYWAVANIPTTVTYSPTDAGRRDGTRLPTGAVQGRNDFGYAGFGGARPPKGDKPHRYQLKVWALRTDKIPMDSSSSGTLIGYMPNANRITATEITLVYEIKQGKSMLAKNKSSLKTEEIRMHKHHEIHRVKPLVPALCCTRQEKKVINQGVHSLTVDSNQIILFPRGYELYITNYPETGLYLTKMLYYPTDLIEKFQELCAITDQIRDATGFCLSQNSKLIYCWG